MEQCTGNDLKNCMKRLKIKLLLINRAFTYFFLKSLQTNYFSTQCNTNTIQNKKKPTALPGVQSD